MKTGKFLDFNKICLWTVLSLLSLVCPGAMALTTEEIVGLDLGEYNDLWTADPVLLPENYNGVLYIELLTAEGKTWEAYEYCRNHSLEMSVSNPDILELREEGLCDYGWSIGITAKGAGTTVISFKIEGTSITLAREVRINNNVEITDIQIDKVNTSLLVEGAEITLNVHRTPYWSAEPIEWISSNPEIMQLIPGKASGNSAKFALVGSGKCEITVRSLSNPAVYATKTFTVDPTPPLKSIYIDTPAAFESELAKDYTYKFIAEGNPSIFSDRLIWNCSDESVLRIEPDGDSVLVTGVSLGEAILSIKSVDNPGIYKNINIKVVTPGITMWEDLPSGIYEGDSYNLGLRLTPSAEPVNPRVVEVSVSDPSILKVSAEYIEICWYSCTVEAFRPGVAEVIFTEPISGAKLMKSVTVKERVLESLQISGPQEIFTDLGKEYKYTVSAFPKGVSAAVEWSVKNSGIGDIVRKENSTVYVRPTASGTLMLKATSIANPEISVSKEITVSTPVLSLPDLVRIEENDKWKYVVIDSNAMSVLFEEAYDYPFEIESSDPEVVKASREGGEWDCIRLEPVSPGLAIVTVRYKGGNLHASMKVVVEPYDLSSLENCFGDENKFIDIYKLNGQIIVKGGTLENLTKLPSGLYIVNGMVYLKN